MNDLNLCVSCIFISLRLGLTFVIFSAGSQLSSVLAFETVLTVGANTGALLIYQVLAFVLCPPDLFLSQSTFRAIVEAL